MYILSYRGGSWTESELNKLSKRLQDIAWVPTCNAGFKCIGHAFNPNVDIGDFHVVGQRNADIDTLVEGGLLLSRQMSQTFHSPTFLT